MAFRMLALGDIHLGRRPSPLPSGLDPSRLGPAAAWERTVEAAVEADVDALALAGDVVEREDDFFEAYRHLSRGVARLAGAGVAVVAVAGNHDGRVLPRLASEMGAFRLLGAGGRWEAILLEGGGERVRLWGWSMPSGGFRRSPLEGAVFPVDEVPALGLLHADVDGGGGDSPYAPTAPAELERSGLDGWLLGHVHRPDALRVPRPLGYLGSLCGLDAGEPGPRGPWLITVDGGRVAAVEQWLLAPMRWERLDVDLSGIADAGEAQGRLLAELRRLDGLIARSLRVPEAVGLRLALTGRTSLGSAAGRLLGEEGAVLFEGEGKTAYFVESLRVMTRPVKALTRLAEGVDPPGLLARKLLALDDDGSRAGRRLLDEARRRLEALCDRHPWAELPRPSLDDEALAEELRRVGLRLLEELEGQRGERP